MTYGAALEKVTYGVAPEKVTYGIALEKVTYDEKVNAIYASLERVNVNVIVIVI